MNDRIVRNKRSKFTVHKYEGKKENKSYLLKKYHVLHLYEQYIRYQANAKMGF